MKRLNENKSAARENPLRGKRVFFRPTAEEVLAAWNKTIPDIIAPGLHVLFVGINPGLYTAAIGHHFGRPGNRFWPALYNGGFTRRLLLPYEEQDLLTEGCGITNMVARATPTADDLTKEELVAGGKTVTKKIRRFKPRFAAFVGITSYRTAFNRPGAQLGLQPETIGDTRLWVLPNPSGLNAHYQANRLAVLFRALKEMAF